MVIYKTLENGIKIVEYEPHMAAAVADMWSRCGDDWGGTAPLRTENMVRSNQASSTALNTYIAMDGENVAGYCSLGKDYSDTNSLYVQLLGVSPDYQGKKIGKALVLMCVQRTMELEYPRLALYTWSGNTAAVPLYKKCGFLWEDRSNSTHLINFIPMILSSPLFTGYFTKADWYSDSARALDITPDGVKINEFDTFTYVWEKDGQALKIGFERSGKQVRMIETADYKIEFMAESHKLAYGLDYGCTFTVENKTGKELRLKVSGKEDKNIKFDYSLDTVVTGKQEYSGSFYVGEIDKPQDSWRIHPCVCADVEINGVAITFGMGISPQFPISFGIVGDAEFLQVGMEIDTYLNVASSLPLDAQVTFSIPEQKLSVIDGNPFSANIPARGKVCFTTRSKILSNGFVTLQVPGTAVLSDGREINFTARLDMLSKDLSSTISWENYYGHYIACGPWSIALYKNSGRANISHINQGYWGNLHAPQFGKPYEDEFGQIDPIVKTYQEGTKMIIEAEFASKKFPGMVVTQVYTLCASGIVTRANRIENRSGEVSHAVLLDSYGLGVEQYAVFSYKGKIVQNQANPTSAGIAWGVGPRDMAGIDENWVYQDSPNNPMGFIWPSDYKPLELMYSYISFEIDPGGLAQGQIFETKPVIYVHGMFSNYNDFRNYAMKINKKEAEIPVNMVELCINGYNPFVSAEAIKLEVTNNTAEDFAGELIVSAGNLIERQQQTNEPGDSPASNVFELPVKDATGYAEVINLKMNMLGYMKSFDRAIFFPKGDVSFIKDGTIHAVSNGRLTFRADPAYGSGCYSIIDVKGQEWLLHQHPNPHRTLGWQNPNMGGIVCFPPDMYHTAILKEKISAEFTNVTDNYGNIWQGICTTISINEEEALKGAALKSYYVTLPGLPMMCIFIKFENTTGEYKNIGMGVGAVFNIAEDHKDITIELCDKPGREYQFRMGSEANSSFENAITVKSKRAETLYMFHGNKIPGRYNSFHSNSKIQLGMDFWVSASAKDKETYTSSPVFLFLTEKDVPRDALDDLGRIRF